MKLKRPTSRFVTALVAVASITLIAGCRGSMEDRAEKVTARLSKKLDLNDEQKKEFQTLVEQAIADMKENRETHLALGAELEKQVLSETADTTELKNLLAAQATKRQALTDKWLGLAAQFHAKLNPEQKKKAAEAISKFRSKFQSKHHGRHDRKKKSDHSEKP
ncbi:MAG: Spy/CpxP family protein refolding chaperone [Bdellovibrionales bacterium]|jgi:Spy/CpxP family protein refolding chaperone|nr:Spy/CpxP family protein refolding chaperone [Bdellovibrionales bacterium]